MWRYLFGSKLKACFDILGSVHLTKGAFLDMFYETELPAGLVFRVDWFHILMEEKSKTKTTETSYFGGVTRKRTR